MNALEKLCD